MNEHHGSLNGRKPKAHYIYLYEDDVINIARLIRILSAYGIDLSQPHAGPKNTRSHLFRWLVQSKLKEIETMELSHENSLLK